MLEKIKKHWLKVVVFLINIGLIGGGVAYIKNQQDKKKSAELEQMKNEAQQEAEQTAVKAQELEQIIKNSAIQKTESIATNPSEVTVQQPKTVTERIPGQVTTVKTTAPAPKKTTKKS
ncbi:MAG: hypothetical protein ACD_15C00018G0003 [uncultured bacterium]|nr:MAG: hypothetical protein ACD_15C00018G0003 [uncultured bacterium]